MTCDSCPALKKRGALDDQRCTSSTGEKRTICCPPPSHAAPHDVHHSPIVHRAQPLDFSQMTRRRQRSFQKQIALARARFAHRDWPRRTRTHTELSVYWFTAAGDAAEQEERQLGGKASSRNELGRSIDLPS